MAVTPNGRADAVTKHGHQKVFALPNEERMTVSLTRCSLFDFECVKLRTCLKLGPAAACMFYANTRESLERGVSLLLSWGPPLLLNWFWGK